MGTGYEVDTILNENKVRNIQIQELSRGYLVQVGCQSFAIENTTKLLDLLKEYLLNPQETEKKWFDKTLF